MKPTKPIIQFLAAFAVASGAANAAVTLVDSAFETPARAVSGPTTINHITSVTTGGNILVVGAYGDNGTAGSAMTLNFGGNAPTGRVDSGRGMMAYYLAPSTGSLTINLTAGVDALGLMVWELTGVDLAGGVVSTPNGVASDTITTTVANTFVVGSGWRNGGGTEAVPSPSIEYKTTGVFDNNDIAPFVVGQGFPHFTGFLGGASGLAATPGTHDISWTNHADGSALAFGFVAVPEPSAALLGAIGLIALLRRRRSA